LKIARLIFFFSGRARESDFLALVDLVVLFLAIFHPLDPHYKLHLSRRGAAVTVGRPTGARKCVVQSLP
jgi:hypothetical protein